MNLESRARELRLQYSKEWRAKNKERKREYNRRYWEKKALNKMRDDKKDGETE